MRMQPVPTASDERPGTKKVGAYILTAQEALHILQCTNTKDYALTFETFSRPNLVTLPAYEADE